MLKRLLGGQAPAMPYPPVNYPYQQPTNITNPGMSNPYYGNPNVGNYDINRLQTEINELKRINSDMQKRISRLENYLGIRSDNLV